MSDDKLDHTVVRDSYGRLLPGTASLNRNGPRGKARTVAFRLRRRYDAGGSQPEMVENLIGALEDIALNVGQTIATKDQLQAIVHLLRMYAGRALFEHAGDDEQGDLAAARPARQFYSVDAVDRQAASIAAALGTTVDDLPRVLEAALEYQAAIEQQREEEADGLEAKTA